MKPTLLREPYTCGQSVHRSELATDCDCAAVDDSLARPVLPYPTIYSLELTPACNNRCPGCSNVFLANKSTRSLLPHQHAPLSAAHWGVILDTIAPYAQRIRLTGGEATLHPQFQQIVQMIQQRQLRFTLFTNGRWKQPAALLALLQESTQCQGLLVSLHGADAATHECFSGIASSFHETVENIRCATHAGLIVHTNTVFTHQNWHQVERIAALSQSLGARCAVFNRYIGPPAPEHTLTNAELQQASRAVSQLQQAGQPVRFGACLPQCFVETSSTGCLAGTAYCTIDPWGNLRPCSHAIDTAGNLFTQPLAQIWQSPAMHSWRQLLAGACRDCNLFTRCYGGCRAEAQLHGTQYDPLIHTGCQECSQGG